MRGEDINSFDHFVAGNSSESTKLFSDYPFYGSLTPLAALVLLNKDMNKKSRQLGVLYIQTLAVTSTLSTSPVALLGLQPHPRPE